MRQIFIFLYFLCYFSLMIYGISFSIPSFSIFVNSNYLCFKIRVASFQRSFCLMVSFGESIIELLKCESKIVLVIVLL